MELKIYCIASNQHANNKQFRSFVTFLHYDSDAKSPMGRITPLSKTVHLVQAVRPLSRHNRGFSLEHKIA